MLNVAICQLNVLCTQDIVPVALGIKHMTLRLFTWFEVALQNDGM